MDALLIFTLVGILAFLAGSIPTGFLVAKAQGIDIRSVGSGNIGATNAFRVLGKFWGSFVLAVDILKGALPVVVVTFALAGHPHLIALKIFAAVLTVLGHNFTPWLGFKGGKGVATSAGALLGLMPIVSVSVIVIFVVVFKLTGYVSVGSITAAFFLPIITAFLYRGSPEFVPFTTFAAVLGILAIVRHKSNIRRLIDGTENRFGRKKEETSNS
ncbi:glycerol-3-phosphate 1-O-acyltransferase PlsY [Oscillatoria amoena NRMC-F 0135]|nr:glycerol-3-phosphate 1-O-acyltransferase PlsY [Oscillatoria amoena NRMC-F 0135]MDL5053503.1 glycerol-3-phosphate 1-O-acyltransferase PlsY [Oscillatoria laete-virens NRMC-F 0139]